MHRFAGFWDRPHGCAPRGGRHAGFGGLFGQFGGGEFGWHSFRAGRKLGSNDLQLLILALLNDKPAHGYEIIKALEERSGGFYTPSPGMVYPALTYLEEVGHVASQADGTKKLYEITAPGRAYLEQNREVADRMFRQLAWIGEKMEHVRRAFGGEREGESATSSDTRYGMSRELHEARMELRAALGEKKGSTLEEQRRIAEILKRAADQVRGK